jgi:hypothetical protein
LALLGLDLTKSPADRPLSLLAALASQPETADQRRLRLLATEVARLEARHKQLELANAWLIQVVQHFMQAQLGNRAIDLEQLKQDWNSMAEAFGQLERPRTSQDVPSGR